MESRIWPFSSLHPMEDSAFSNEVVSIESDRVDRCGRTPVKALI